MTSNARARFDVRLTPQAPDDPAADPTFGRLAIDKQFHGGLEATSKGAMPTARTDVESSAGYVH